MKNVLIIVALSTLLAACTASKSSAFANASEPGKATGAASARVSPAPVSMLAASHKVALNPVATDAESALPPGSLTPELLYKYLSAELAEQRGVWQAAYVTMLAMAQETRDPRIARRAAEIALNAKQADESLAAVRLWRELAPGSEEAEQYYLGFIILGDDLSEAQPVLQERLKQARPQTLGATIFQVQRLLARARNKNTAFSLLDELLKPYQTVPEARLALAQGAFIQGDTARASQEAAAALAANPRSEMAALTLAQVTPDKAEAANILAKFLVANPNSREVRLARARLLVEQKQYDAARGEFKTLLTQQPDDLTTLYALGLLGTQSNDMTEAENYLTTYLRVLATKPEEGRDATQALLVLAQIAEQRNDIDAALKWLDQVDSKSSQAYIGAQIKRAQLIAKNGDIAGARELLHTVDADGEAERTQLLAGEAQILRNADQTEEAMSVLDDGIKTFPENVDLLYDHAMAAEKLGKLDLMETSLRKIMKLAPGNQHAYNALGYSLAERNLRLQEAFTLIEKALQLAPQDPFIMDSMGWVQYRLGRLAEAEDHLRRAYLLKPDPEIAAHLGEVLWVKGQREDAKKLWRDANGKDPSNDTLKSTLSRLQIKL